MRLVNKFREGAASFYIVAFSTLILVIVATSFAVVVISEVARTSNDDLSQSAYDAALAGVEDAKLAYANYQACVAKGAKYTGKLSDSDAVTCEDIMYWMYSENTNKCDMVAHILGRIGKDEAGEVMISETTGPGANNMNQAYTCARIDTILPDYRASLSSSNAYRVVRVKLDDKSLVQNIKYVKVSWYSKKEGEIYNFNNALNAGIYRVAFQPLKSTKAATPPTISVGLIQTAESFKMAELNSPTISGQTDRATVYLVPSDDLNKASDVGAEIKGTSTYRAVYDKKDEMNKLSKAQVASTNNLYKNIPFLVYCDGKGEFMCSALLELPEPINGKRNNETFMFVVSLPYEVPDTDFAMEFCTGESSCVSGTITETTNDTLVNLRGMQVTIDSTGRANDLYRRVEVRMEETDASFSYVMHTLELTGKSSGEGSELIKNMTVTSEYSNSSYTDLPDFGSITKGMYNVGIYPKVEGVEYPAGLSGFTFNVYVDGDLVARNVTTDYRRVSEGKTVRVELNNVPGFIAVNGTISETIDKNKTIMPEWNVAYYPVSLTTVIEGRTFEDGYQGFAYNVWEGNRLVGEAVKDYYNARVKYGTKVTVEPISRASGCNGKTVEKTIVNETTIVAEWTGSCLPHLAVKTKIDGVESTRDGFTFSVYLGDGGAPAASNVTSFDQDVASGTNVRIVVNAVSGYTVKESSILINNITGGKTIYPEWNINYYTVDVNSVIDGETYGQGKDGFAFDVKLNGNNVATNVIDYYNEHVAHGTRVEVVPRKASGYETPENVSGTVDASNLYLSPVWHKKDYNVDVNEIVNGVKYSTGVHGLTFDVYVNDALVANDWTDFSGTYTYGTKVRVKANSRSGFTLSNADVTLTVKGPTEFTPTWTSSTSSVYTVDVNPVINGTEYANGLSGFTFSVYINGNLVKSNVIDFCEDVIQGARVRVVANDVSHYSMLNNRDVTYTINSNTSFSPTWGENVTTINYNGNGADSGTTVVQYVSGGVSEALRGSGFTKTGYTFAGWNTAANGSGTAYSAGGLYTAPEIYNNTITLYAQWRENARVTINYNANGGSGSVASQSLLSGQTVTIRSNGFSRSGYAFMGWNTKSGGGGASYVAGQSYTPNYSSDTTITLYAQWKLNATVTIRYYGNGGSGSMSSQSVVSGTSVTISSNDYTRIGYTFAGWNTNSNGTGDNYNAGQVWTPIYTTNTTINLYAKWTFTGTYMQDFTTAQCQSLASSEDYYVFDRRDMQRYTVRYANNQCWMTSNLRIFTSTGQETGTITSTDSNFSNVVTWKLNKTDTNSYTEALAYSGGYYNYCAATAGNGNGCTQYDGSTNSGDICPKNWRLPSGSSEVYNAFYDNEALTNSLTGTYWTTQYEGYWEFGGGETPDGGQLQCAFYNSNNKLTFSGGSNTSCYNNGSYYGTVRKYTASMRCVHK